MRRTTGAAVMAALLALLAAGCTGAPARHHGSALVRLPVGPPGTTAAGTVRLGFGLGVDDAAAVVGWQLGIYQQYLGRATLDPEPFASPVAETAALEDGQLDAAYLDPVAAVAAVQASHGSFVIVSGAASGGAELVVQRGITRAGQLRHRLLAAPPGGVQQAAADAWLRGKGLPALTRDEAAPSTDAGVLHEFLARRIAGAWEPAPLDAQLAAAGGRVLVDEAASWPGGQFPASVLVVARRFLAARRSVVTGLLEGQLRADQFLTADKAAAEGDFREKLITSAGITLPAAVLARSFASVTFTVDPMAAVLGSEIREAVSAGLLRPVTSVAGLLDLGPINALLGAAGRKPVTS